MRFQQAARKVSTLVLQLFALLIQNGRVRIFVAVAVCLPIVVVFFVVLCPPLPSN